MKQIMCKLVQLNTIRLTLNVFRIYYSSIHILEKKNNKQSYKICVSCTDLHILTSVGSWNNYSLLTRKHYITFRYIKYSTILW